MPRPLIDPPEVVPPKPPKFPATLASELDPDIDPEFPDVAETEIEGMSLSFPEARTLTILRSKLTGCDLDPDTEVSLDVVDSTLIDLDLTGRTVESLCRVVLVRCRLGGADLGDAQLTDVDLDGCVLDLASMRSARLERVRLVGGRVDGLDLTGAQLTDATFEDLSLAEVALDGARLERVDLTAADLSGVVDVSTLRGATIGESQAIALSARLARAAGIAVTRRP